MKKQLTRRSIIQSVLCCLLAPTYAIASPQGRITGMSIRDLLRVIQYDAYPNLFRLGGKLRSSASATPIGLTFAEKLTRTTSIDNYFQQDFSRGDTTLIGGWLVSKNEARLCMALYESLHSNNKQIAD